jgi:hypothetical protein
VARQHETPAAATGRPARDVRGQLVLECRLVVSPKEVDFLLRNVQLADADADSTGCEECSCRGYASEDLV